jgi:hypothetical protein
VTALAGCGPVLSQPHELLPRLGFAWQSSIEDAPELFTNCAAMPPFKDDQIIVCNHVGVFLHVAVLTPASDHRARLRDDGRAARPA